LGGLTVEEQKIALQVLSVGTKILTKDVMDQYLRSLGDIKTFYGSKLNFAVSTFNEKKIDLVFCEMNFGDSSAQYFLKKNRRNRHFKRILFCNCK
jgi:hypothetical protein